MYAFSADMSTIRQKETRKAEYLREQRLKTSLKAGCARRAEWGSNISRKRNKTVPVYGLQSGPLRLAEQGQMAELFQTSPQNVTIHIRNIYDEGELQKLPTCKEYLQVQQEGSRIVRRRQKIYNLDVIISVGYRVKSIRGTQFRQWANGVLKAYLIKGYSINAQLLQISQDINKRLESHAITLADHESVLKEHSKKIDFFIQSSLPPKQGIFFDGQIYDAYAFVADLVRKATRRIVLIDNYIDDTVLMMWSIWSAHPSRTSKRNGSGLR